MESVVRPHRPKQSPEDDYSTNSNYRNFQFKKTTLNLEVMFDEKILKGFAEFSLKALTETNEIVLDTSNLEVTKALINGSSVQFKLLKQAQPLGSPLVVYPVQKMTQGESAEVRIEYRTTRDSSALQWLDPVQTDGGKLPYLFSQCEPIHARSFFPCFDTPSVKSEYFFTVKSSLPVLMSGRKISSTAGTYQFHQPVPIPSYLVAIASGDLVGAEIGPRSTVYSEPCMIDACQEEFKCDTEGFIATAESLIFPYEWKIYDVLVLNKAMPFGGMEHPNITFATPTLISGDRQNVDVIAHELAHSWSGNLVTNASWDHFWLNEGWTVYIERRILGKIHGEKYRQFSALMGWTDLEISIKAMGNSAKRYSCLVQNLQDRSDPDDAFSTVPYEKGFCLLYTIEKTLGIEEFDKFIPYYFGLFKYKSLDTYQFVDTLYDFFSNKTDSLDTIDWQGWLYEPGLPEKPDFDTTLADQCYQLASRWVDAVRNELPLSQLKKKFTQQDISAFSANQNVVFLDTIVSHQGVSGFTWNSDVGRQALELMRSLYSEYESSGNAEVIFRWFRVQLSARVTSSYKKLADWLGTVGRMKFVRPSYVMLNQVDPKLARQTFHKYEQGYHPICRAMVKKDLNI